MGAVTIFRFYVICYFHFTLRAPQVCYILEFLLYISSLGMIIPLHLSYIYVCIDMFDMFVYLIMMSVLICLCMLYNIIFGYTSPGYFVLHLSVAWVIPPLHQCYIYVGINMFMHVIYMVTAICLCTLYGMILG